VAVSEDLGWAPVEPSVRAAFRAAVDRLADDGARVTEAAPAAPYPTELWNDIALPEGFASEGPLLERWGEQMTAGTREIVESGRAASAADYLDALERRADYARRWGEFFGEHDVLLTPSMPLPAFSTDVQTPASIDGVPVDPFFDDWCALALPANLTGCPATAVPTGLDPDGLPVGMQVMAPRGCDARTLAVAAAFERLAPWPRLRQTAEG
jgi:Asp-tRNA(Asn)/Glu-tRNA(Gln) amidotransferase A subunit family amidase